MPEKEKEKETTAPPKDEEKKPEKESKPAKEEKDDDIFTEILEELKTQVDESIYDSVKNLTVPKQIKILKSVVKGMKTKPEEKTDEKKSTPAKKIVKPTDMDEPAPETQDDEIVPISKRYTNKEDWLKNFMNSDKLYYKGKFMKTG